MAKFDIIFLLKYLVKIATINPVIHNGRIISLTIDQGKNNEYLLEFKDSYLILINNLRKLSETFKVENIKSIFPHFFVDKNNLDYIGSVPNINYFDDKVTKEEYLEYYAQYNNN